MNRQQAIGLIKKSLVNTIHTTGYKAFERSRQKCPIVTGRLKSTGKDKILDIGYEFQYGNDKVNYASFVERGTEPGMRYVEIYRRKDGVIVRAHSFFSKGQHAQHFIESSMKEVFTQDFAQDFDNQMRLSGIKVVKV